MHVVSEPDDRGAGLLMSPVRRAIVDALSDHAPGPDEPRGLTAAQLAEALDLHVTTVRFHLDQLVAAGLVEAEFTKAFGVGRPRKVYSVAPGSFADAREHDALKMLSRLLADAFGDPGTTPEQAGEAWARDHVPPVHGPAASTPGEWLGKVGRMVDVLQDWGYTPDLTTSDGGRTARVDLHHCPFLELAESNPAVVCGVHRGLIRGALRQLGEEDAGVSLEPFVGPRLCQAHVTTRTPFRSPPRRS